MQKGNRFNWFKGKEHFIILLFFGALLIMIGCLNHYFFRTYAHDYGTYGHEFFDHANFTSNVSYIPCLAEGVYFLELHQYLLFFLITPFYWIMSWLTGTYTLLIVQALFTVFGGYGLYLFIKEYSNSRMLSIFALLFYFLFIGRYTSFTSDYNDYTVGVSLIPWFFFFNLRKKWLFASVFLVLLWLCKENVALLTAFFSAFLLIKYRKDKERRIANAIFLLSSLAFFVLSFTVIIPLIYRVVGHHEYTGFLYNALGDTPFDALITLVTRPYYVASLFFTNHLGDSAPSGIKLELYLIYVFSGGWLLFLRPQYLLLVLPIFAQKMLHSSYGNWGMGGFYIIDLAVILPMAVIMVISDIRLAELKKRVLSYFILLSVIAVTVWKMNDHNRAIKWYKNDKECFYCPEMYTSPFDVEKVYDAIELIPDDARVSASSSLVPHLAFRENIYFFPVVFDAEYIAFLNTDPWPMSYEIYIEEKNKYLTSDEWEVLVNDEPIQIVRRK